MRKTTLKWQEFIQKQGVGLDAVSYTHLGCKG